MVSSFDNLRRDALGNLASGGAPDQNEVGVYRRMAATSFLERALTHVRTRQRNKLCAGRHAHGWVKGGEEIAVEVGTRFIVALGSDHRSNQSGESASSDGAEVGDVNVDR